MAENRMFADLAARYGMEAKEFIAAVKLQCFASGACSDAQLALLLSVAFKYDLNPLVRELHAFVNPERGNKMEIVVGVDGWFKIVARDDRVLGWEDEEHRDASGKLVAVTVRIYRKDRFIEDRDGRRYLPGKYRGVLDEWLVERKPGKGPTNWEEMPEHRLFGVAFKECARRTLGITEFLGDDDEAKLRAACPVADGTIVTPAPAATPALEHQPLEPINLQSMREAVPVADRPHLKVKLDSVVTAQGSDAQETAPEAAKGSPPFAAAAPHGGESSDGSEALVSSPSAQTVVGQPEASAPAGPAEAAPACCQFKGCVIGDGLERVEVEGDSVWLCHPHAEAARPKRRGRKPKEGAAAPAPAAEGQAAAETPAAQAQRAAGLEQIDPNEGELETFARVHDVPERRLNLMLSKYGAAKPAELTADQRVAILQILKKAYGVGNGA